MRMGTSNEHGKDEHELSGWAAAYENSITLLGYIDIWAAGSRLLRTSFSWLVGWTVSIRYPHSISEVIVDYMHTGTHI